MTMTSYRGRFTDLRYSDGVEHEDTVGISGLWRVGIRVTPNELIVRLFYTGQSPSPWKSASYRLEPSKAVVPAFPLDKLAGTLSLDKEQFLFRCNTYIGHVTNDLSITINEYYEAEEEEEKVDQVDFFSASTLADVVLIVDAKKIHVNKNFLAMHSKYFETLFFGQFAQMNAREVALPDIDYAKFIKFLRVIHPVRKLVTRANAEAILHMATFFDSRSARLEVVRFLNSDCCSFSDLEKLVLADRYLLSDMEDHLLEKLKTQEEVLSVMQFGYNKLSQRLKARLVDKIGPLL